MTVAGCTSLNTETASDIELVAAVRAGADEAFEELYRRYQDPIACFARRFVRDHGRAEDVAQEAFVSALRRMRQTECEIQFKPWIYEIARNAAIDSLRRAGRAQEVSFEVHAGADAVQLAAPGAPEASALDRERFENFRGALDELNESQHRIIVMRELEGLSYREIGARMHLSPAAVESTLFRARRKLGHEYAQLDTGRRCQSMGIVIARLAEGVESRADRVRLDRHARRCSTCRARSRWLGVEPILAGSLCRKAAALLPLPGFLRGPRGLNSKDASGVARVQQAAGAIANPGFETAIQGAGKAAAVVASVLAIGGMGATLGGIGPLAVDGGGKPDPGNSTGGRDSDPAKYRDALVPPSGSPGLSLPGFPGVGYKRPSASQREQGDRRTGQTPGSFGTEPSERGPPAALGVPDLPSAERRKVPIPASEVETQPVPDLTAPSLPPEPQAPSLPEGPAPPSGDGVLDPVRTAPAPAPALPVQPPSQSLPPA